MSLPVIMAILSAVIPTLVQEAEKALGAGNGDKKRQWVVDGVNDILSTIEKKVPSLAGTLIQMAEPLVDDLINVGLTSAGLN